MAYKTLSHGAFSSNATQTITGATTSAYVITYTDTENADGVTLTENSKINIPTSGDYLVTFSAILKSSVANKQIDIWMSLNGSNVARTNTVNRLVGAGNERICTVTFIYQFKAGDYMELYWSGSDAGCTLTATGTQTNPTRPASPSIILTVNRVN